MDRVALRNLLINHFNDAELRDLCFDLGTQASDPAQRAMLHAVARTDQPWTLPDLETATGLDPDTLRQQLRWAEHHDILKKVETDPPVWQFYVPLMRRWIRERA
jgi:hypothetical protein